MKFLPTTATSAATALFLASTVVNMVDAGVCISPNGVCSTDNNGEAQVFNGVTYCVDDGCTIQLGESDITEICGVTIAGIQTCPETYSAVRIVVKICFFAYCSFFSSSMHSIMTRINQSINQSESREFHFFSFISSCFSPQ